jgi:nickel/cobalt exporter
VLILAIITTYWPSLDWIKQGLGLVMGIVVVCMGFWLLLQRLAGRADHVHLDSGAHASAEKQSSRTLTWWGLTMLGVIGGMVPCWDAVGIYCISIATGAQWLVLPALLAFSAGLALVLVLIGVLIVQVPRFAQSRFGSGTIVRALPIVSAVIVTMMGFWLCYEAVHGN